MTAILVTGGAGYIGSRTCKALHRVGFDPVICDNLTRGNPEAMNEALRSVRELIASVREVTERDVPLHAGPRRPGDPAVHVADAARARERLG